ncbi:hypothetical protein IWQ62_000895 [Dispira parvispora]|uniref:Uncharacterized protein n=1 Tax=Dispira parvispora TaxID=1520584 RepID=A0A9W8AZ49_9FUNG|nr:hypothetical protein IWQ62_000895 [Dispira parvispora]
MPQDKTLSYRECANLRSTDETAWKKVFHQSPEQIEVWRYFAEHPPNKHALTAMQSPEGLPFKTIQVWLDGLVDEKHYDSALQLWQLLQSPGFSPGEQTLSRLFQWATDPTTDPETASFVLENLQRTLVLRSPKEVLRCLWNPANLEGLWEWLRTLLERGATSPTYQNHIIPQVLRLLVTAFRHDLLDRDRDLAKDLRECLFLQTFSRPFNGCAMTQIQQATDTLFWGLTHCVTQGTDAGLWLHELFHILVLLAFMNYIDLNTLVSHTYQWLHHENIGVQQRFVRNLQSDNFRVLVLDIVLQNECSLTNHNNHTPGRRTSLTEFMQLHFSAVTALARRPSTRHHTVSPEWVSHMVVSLCLLIESYINSHHVITPQGTHLGLRPVEVGCLSKCGEVVNPLEEALGPMHTEAVFHLQMLKVMLMHHYVTFYQANHAST